MTAPCTSIQYRRLRAPSEHGQRLIEPSVSSIVDLWYSNQTALHRSDIRILDSDLAALRIAAQHDLIERAEAYTRQYRDVTLEVPPSAGVVLAGHQPELFHAGVWYKNFVLSALSQRLGATAVNLVIDNDDCKSTAIRVPTGRIDDPSIVTIPFDAPAGIVPYEVRRVTDRSLFASFGDRVASTISTLIPEPLVRDLWEPLLEIAESCNTLGTSLAALRHRLEATWGLNTLELPLSSVCDSLEFAQFTGHLLTDLAKLHEVYNRSLREYRRVNHVRSYSHPVPDLDLIDGWYEAPFWIWRRDQPRRQHLFVKQVDRQLWLSDRKNLEVPIDLKNISHALIQLESDGICVRPRALITTMYGRLVLSSMFIHGIGGAKYDQLTDQIICRFFDMDPPAYLTTTATTLLPLQRPTATVEDLRRVDWMLRELSYHGELYLDPSLPGYDQALQLAREKRKWLESRPSKGEGHSRHVALTRINESLQPFLQPKRMQLENERDETESEWRKSMLLGSREFSFCLHDTSSLRALLMQMAVI